MRWRTWLSSLLLLCACLAARAEDPQAPAPTRVVVLGVNHAAHRVAIASFNLLGAQAGTGNVDWPWIARVLDALEREREDPETRLLRTRHARLTGRIDASAAAERYRAIAADPAARAMPTWNGVLDRSRVDSYFDPFGNLRTDQRARGTGARAVPAGRCRGGRCDPSGAAGRTHAETGPAAPGLLAARTGRRRSGAGRHRQGRRAARVMTAAG